MCVCVSLADGLELHPGVDAPDLQRRVVAEDVVAQLVQRRLRVGGGVLSRLLHLLTDRHVDLLAEEEEVILILRASLQDQSQTQSSLGGHHGTGLCWKDLQASKYSKSVNPSI